MPGGLALIWPVMTAAFLASLVEAVEALTIVLAVATVRGWRPAGLGALAGLAVLALIVVALGPLLGHLPLRLLQFVIGVLLLLFGMRWLRKAILRSAGVIPLHDEATAFATETQNCANRPAVTKRGSIGSQRSPPSRLFFSKGLKWCSS
jgi:Ca2+/H+ antiporter, TMEM165/GDT1 family